MNLFYRKSGTGGNPLVILHGLFSISDNWNSLAKLWSEYFTVYAVDLRNHGQSPWSEEWNYKVMAEDVLELIAKEKLENISLLGHSMGGKTGMRLALDHPGVISKLIVSDIAPRFYEEHNQKVVDALLLVKPENLLSRKEAEAILSQHIKDNGTLQFLLKNLYWKEIAGGKQQLSWRFNLDVISRKISIVSDATNEPAPCPVKTLFVRGERSDYILPEDEKSIRKIFSDSTIETITDAGHWIHADNPKEMFDAVLRFAL